MVVGDSALHAHAECSSTLTTILPAGAATGQQTYVCMLLQSYPKQAQEMHGVAMDQPPRPDAA